MDWARWAAMAPGGALRLGVTVVGSGGGGTYMYHYRYPRALTNRELARLQSFRDDFVFEGSKQAVRKQIGSAPSKVFK